MREREAVREKMGGSVTHPDWEEEGRTDSVIILRTARGGRKVAAKGRREGTRGAQ